jgi:hypothetical protein
VSWLRAAIVILWLPVVIIAFFDRLLREVRSAFWFAWNDVRIEHDEMRQRWRSNQFNPEDWK